MNEENRAGTRWFIKKHLGAKAVNSAAVVVVDALTDARGAPAHALTGRPVSVFIGEYQYNSIVLAIQT